MKRDIDFDHSPGRVLQGTTRAYKRIKIGMFWCEIRSGFKEPGGTPPPRIPRSWQKDVRQIIYEVVEAL